MPTCNLCGAVVARLAKSHIVPNSMTKELGEGAPLVALRATHVHDVRGGLWDRIVCGPCELSFHAPDDYAIEFRRRLIGGRTTQSPMPGSRLQIRAHVANAELLHRFALQTLLRSHLSQRTEHDAVRLGDDAKSLVDAVRQRTSMAHEQWSVSLRFIRGDIGAVFLAPETKDADGMPVHVVTVPHLTFMVTGPSTGPLPAFGQTSLRPGSNVLVWHARSWASPEWGDFVQAFEDHRAGIDRLLDRR